jgi:hypothetical protein
MQSRTVQEPTHDDNNSQTIAPEVEFEEGEGGGEVSAASDDGVPG